MTQGFKWRLPLAAAACAFAASAGAVPLTPGSVAVGPPGLAAAGRPSLAGTVVEDVVVPFSYQGWLTDSTDEPVTFIGNVTGTVQSRVVRSIDSTYDFYWRISVDDASFLPVLELDVLGFGPGSFHTGWRADGLGRVVPATVAQSLAGDVRFTFGEFIEPSHQVRPGEQSRFVFLDTDARGYTAGAFYTLASGRDTPGSMLLQWGGASDRYATFMPTTPVPEPSAGWLALAGLAVVGAVARRSRRR